MRNIFYTLKPIQELAAKGFNSAALLEMERMAYQQAAMALWSAPPDVIKREAENVLPSGINLHSLYTQTLAGIMMAPLSKLEEIADEIQGKAELIEAAYVKVLAKNPASLAEKARLEGAVAEDYASLLDAAQHLEAQNIISVARSSRLQSITEPSDGPLQALYQKAQSILESRAAQQQRGPAMRMVG